jgi:hypothetical protein
MEIDPKGKGHESVDFTHLHLGSILLLDLVDLVLILRVPLQNLRDVSSTRDYAAMS